MVELQSIVEVLKPRKNKILLLAQACLPETQFKAFKKLFLDEFGQSGMERDLERLIAETRRMERTGRE